METKLLNIAPVLPSQDVFRDVHWYRKFTGFEAIQFDEMYGVLKRDNLFIHLQWHADTEEDLLLGGSVIKLFVENVKPIFEEYVERNTVQRSNLRLATAWKTNEFAFYDLNGNAVFIVEHVNPNTHAFR